MTDDGTSPAIELPDDWARLIGAVAESSSQRVMIVGGTDAGKSSFAVALLRGLVRAGKPSLLLDTDPGQKMVGPPGTVSLGELGASGLPLLRAMRFVGTTSAAAVVPLLDAAERVAGANAGLIINTSGLVRGPGVPLLLGMAERLRPERVVAIGGAAELQLSRRRTAIDHLPTAPAARRKSRAERAKRRRAMFAAHLASARVLHCSRRMVRVEALPSLCLMDCDARPVCALSGRNGADLSLGVLLSVDADTLTVVAPPQPEEVTGLRLGAMWASPSPSGWRLLDELLPVTGASLM